MREMEYSFFIGSIYHRFLRMQELFLVFSFRLPHPLFFRLPHPFNFIGAWHVIRHFMRGGFFHRHKGAVRRDDKRLGVIPVAIFFAIGSEGMFYLIHGTIKSDELIKVNNYFNLFVQFLGINTSLNVKPSSLKVWMSCSRNVALPVKR